MIRCVCGGGGGNYVTDMCRLFPVIVCTQKCGARRSNVKNKTRRRCCQ